MNRLFELEKELSQFIQKGKQHTLNSPASPVSTAQSVRGGFSKAMGNKRKIVILSIDGGGIRGMIPALILERLEAEIAKESGSSSVHIQSYVDVFAGTSTGGIIAAGLALAKNREIAATIRDPQKAANTYIMSELAGKYDGLFKFTPRDLVSIYETEGEEIFTKYTRPYSWKELGLDVGGTIVGGTIYWGAKTFHDKSGLFEVQYDRSFLDSKLRNRFSDKDGTLTPFSDAIKPCLLTSVNISNGNPVLWNSTNRMHGLNSFYDLVRTTSAAPTYFSPVRIGNEYFVDGGMLENNPSLLAFNEVAFNANGLGLIESGVRKLDGRTGAVHPSDVVVISLGTGATPFMIDGEGMQTAGAVSWIKNTISMLMEATSRRNETELTRICATGNYHRLNPGLTRAVDLADASSVGLLRRETESFLAQATTQRTLNAIAKLLINSR